AFAVLSSRVVQETPDVAGDVGVLDLDVAGLDGEWVPRFLLQLLANRAGTKARNVFRPAVDQPQARTDDVRGGVHGDHAFPVFRPAVHVLWVRSRHVLDLA